MTLRQRVNEAVTEAVKGARRNSKPMQEEVVNAATEVFVATLRERAEVYKNSPEPEERQIRYELLALAGQIETGQA